MCFDIAALPPVPTRPGRPVTSARRTLTSADGTAFAGFLASPDCPSGVGVVVLPDMRGLFRFYEDLAMRLAEQGYTALAIDYYGRTAGAEPRDETFPFREHITRLSRATIDADICAAIGCLRANSCASVLALGFCFGGRQAFLASAKRFGLAGVIGFYGALSFYPNGSPGPLQFASELSAPILGLFGGARRRYP